MEHEFWHDKWQRNDIGFHESEPHPLLIAHWHRIVHGGRGGRVFVPLCGKSVDLLWLAEHDHDVVGVELSEIAVEAFFDENGLRFERTRSGPLVRFAGERITLWCGDYFDLTRATLGEIDWVYDRAALIALPPELRARYVAHSAALLARGAQGLLITIRYAPGLFRPPPFSVEREEVRTLYADRFEIEALAEQPGRVKGHPCLESAHRLVRVDRDG